MKTLRTPDARFTNLPGYPFQPHYIEAPDTEGGQLRIHYLDEGPAAANPLLLLHGEPSWSYLYRKMVPPFTTAGQRVIVPDLVGFGRSDKPTEQSDYTYQRHVDWMQTLLDKIKLQHITLVCQDWGGLIGLRLVAHHPDRFDRVVVANTGLPTGDGAISEAFLQWRKMSIDMPVFDLKAIMPFACARPLADDVLAAYDAPFPDETYKAGARIFPSLVPITPDDPASQANREAWRVLEQFGKPFLTAFSDSDPVTKGGDRIFQDRVPGAKNQPHTTIQNAAHFLQEDAGEELAKVVLDFITSTS
ncbi:haloalkane dehalogenase [bacterium]|nr:haloalkane dehalogenase [bacterium]